MFLRQSTAQVIRFGPCLDKVDGVTEETTLTLGQADMRLSKDGGAYAQKSAAGNATHDSDGHYSTTLSTTDTATVGELRLNVHQPANMLPVWDRWYVVEEAIYDALYGAAATGLLPANLTQILGGAVPTPAITGVPDVNVTHAADSTVVTDTFGAFTVELQSALNDSIGGAAMTDTAVRRLRAVEGGADLVTSAAGTVTTLVDSTLTQANDYWNGMIVEFLSGANVGITRWITDFDAATDTLTFAPAVPTAVANTTSFNILPAGNPLETIAGEPGQATPPATVSYLDRLRYLFKNWRNRKTQTTTEWALFNDDATTKDQKATVSDAAGTFDKTEIESGP